MRAQLVVLIALIAPVLTFGACTDYPAAVGPHLALGADVSGPGADTADPGGDVGPGLGAGDDGVLLPCDLESLLATQCRSCHGETPSGDAPMSLVTRQDLLAPGRLDPTRTMAELSVQRMRSTRSPMPPSPAAPSSEAGIAALEAWILAGAPSGDCEPTPDPFDTETVCTSNAWWRDGDDGSNRMHPGGACVSCHQREEQDELELHFPAAGTVYPTGHEPDDCNGVPTTAGFTVVLTDAQRRVYNLKPNAAGNFYLPRSSGYPFAYPYTAKVVGPGGAERVMVAPQMSGDCNSCHTEAGREDAPGRILAP